MSTAEDESLRAEKPSASDLDGYMKMYEFLRTEAHGYHEVMWKISFATVVAAAGVGSFLLGHIKEMVPAFGPFVPLVVLGCLTLLIGLIGFILAHVYGLYFERTRQMGNVFRNAWLREKTKSQTSDSLKHRINETRLYLKWNLFARCDGRLLR